MHRASKSLAQCIHTKSSGEAEVISISACRFSTKQFMLKFVWRSIGNALGLLFYLSFMKPYEVGIKVQWLVQHQITQLLRGWAEIQTKEGWLQSPHSSTIFNSNPTVMPMQTLSIRLLLLYHPMPTRNHPVLPQKEKEREMVPSLFSWFIDVHVTGSTIMPSIHSLFIHSCSASILSINLGAQSSVWGVLMKVS